MSPSRLPGFVSLFALFSGGMFLLYGCPGRTNPGRIVNVTESAAFPVQSDSTPTTESRILPFPVISTPLGLPQRSKADLSIEFVPKLDDGPSPKNVYALIVHNLGPDPATNITIAHVFPSGTNIDQIDLLQPICQLEGSHVTCDLGNVQANSRMAVTLDLASRPAHPVISQIQRSGSSSDTALPVCSFEEMAGQPLRLMCYVQSLNPGMQAQIDIELRPDIEPGAHKFSVSATQADPDLSNNAGSAALALPRLNSAGLPDLRIQATGPTAVIASQPFTYTYLISNHGTGPATEVKFDDPIPPGLRIESYAPDLPLCKQTGNRLTCSLVDPDSSERVSFTLTLSEIGQQPVLMDVDPLVPGWPVCYVIKEQEPLRVLHCDLGTLQPGHSTHVRLEMLAIGVLERMAMNTVVVNGVEPDLVPADNTNSLNIAVEVQADVLIHADLPTWSATDKTLSFTIEVENQGPSDADGSILTGVLPPGVQLVSANLDLGNECVVEGGKALTCNLSYIKRDEITKLTLVLNVPADLVPQNEAETFLRSLRVIAKALDPNLDNNIIIDPIMISTGETQ